MHVKTEGIVLRESAAGGNARMLTLLTAQLGRVNALAQGAKSLRSSLAASSSQFAYSRLVLFCGQGRYTLDSAEPVELFIELREDLGRLALAQYFAELSIFCAEENMPAPEHLQLLANSLFVLAKTDRMPCLVKACFELRLMSLCGYRPDLECCAQCGSEQPDGAFFDPGAGVFVCRGCAGADGPPASFAVTPGMLEAMRHIVGKDAQRLFSFSLPDRPARLLSRLTEHFAAQQLGRSFPTLEFYKGLEPDGAMKAAGNVTNRATDT